MAQDVGSEAAFGALKTSLRLGQLLAQHRACIIGLPKGVNMGGR